MWRTQDRDRKADLFYAVHLERYLERDMVVLRGAEKGRQAKEEESCQDGSINLRQRDDANTHEETFSRFLYPERERSIPCIRMVYLDEIRPISGGYAIVANLFRETPRLLAMFLLRANHDVSLLAERGS